MCNFCLNEDCCPLCSRRRRRLVLEVDCCSLGSLAKAADAEAGDGKRAKETSRVIAAMINSLFDLI